MDARVHRTLVKKTIVPVSNSFPIAVDLTPAISGP
jgi:hypothetical protein